MRQAHLLLTQEESAALIEQVNQWCRRTGTNYNRLVVAARVNVSTRSAVCRRNRRISIMIATRLRRTMAEYPRGISKDNHKARMSQIREAAKPLPLAELPRIDRTPCPKCGARKDLGCQHWARLERSPWLV